jgi:hypothetical protein
VPEFNGANLFERNLEALTWERQVPIFVDDKVSMVSRTIKFLPIPLL